MYNIRNIYTYDKSIYIYYTYYTCILYIICIIFRLNIMYSVHCRLYISRDEMLYYIHCYFTKYNILLLKRHIKLNRVIQRKRHIIK